jgi:surface antigen
MMGASTLVRAAVCFAALLLSAACAGTQTQSSDYPSLARATFGLAIPSTNDLELHNAVDDGINHKNKKRKRLTLASVTPRVVSPKYRLQCVPFARAESGVQIFGDAYKWWGAANGRYNREDRPSEGAVLVMKSWREVQRGHVAVVTRVLGKRHIIVDHANWLNDGQIYLDTPVEDVSKKGDWSRVRVWHTPSKKWGTRVYTVRGFILPELVPVETQTRVAAATPKKRAKKRVPALS